MIKLQEILPFGMRNNFLNTVQINDGGAMYPLEYGVIELVQQVFHCATHDMRLALCMNTHIVTRSINPGDTVNLDQLDRIPVLDGDFPLVID